MITKLLDINEKSFDNYSCSEEMEKINILFGTNGSGKSSLCNWIYKNNIGTSKLFDSQYVRDNIEAVEEISGVKLVVGQEAIDNEKNIERIKEANLFIVSQNSEIELEETDLKQELYDFMENELMKAKKQFKMQKTINQKVRAKKDPVTALNMWIKEENKSINNLEASTSIEIEQQIELDETNLSLLKMPLEIEKEEILDLIELLKKEVIISSSEISYKLSQWLQEGLEIHNDKEDKCEFCGNNIKINEVKNSIEKRIESEHVELLKSMQIYKNKIKDSINLAKNLPTKEINKNEVQEFIEIANNILNDIEDKEKNSAISISLDMGEWERLNKLVEIVLERKKEISNRISHNREMLLKIEEVAKSWVGKQLNANARVHEIPKVLDQLKKKKEINIGLIESNNEWIVEQESLNSQLKPFADLVNEQFQILGLRIELDVDEDNNSYKIYHKNNDETFIAMNLSEGEKRLIAFLHYYYNLFNEPKEKLKEGIEQVIIDDPITSLDADNRYYITEIINGLIKFVNDKDIQLFIFTHSSMDFHNFGYGNKSNSDTKFWHVYKNEEDMSEIKSINKEGLKNYSDYYQSIMMEVLKFALKNRREVEIMTNYVHYGNKARFILESHARSHYKIDHATTSSLSKLIEAYEIEEGKEDDFSAALNIINSLSHGLSLHDVSVNTLSVKEVQRGIRKIIGVLYNKDNQHIEKICESIIGREERNNIRTWG